MSIAPSPASSYATDKPVCEPLVTIAAPMMSCIYSSVLPVDEIVIVSAVSS